MISDGAYRTKRAAGARITGVPRRSKAPLQLDLTSLEVMGLAPRRSSLRATTSSAALVGGSVRRRCHQPLGIRRRCAPAPSIVSATRDLAGPDVRTCADARELSERAAAATVATIADAVTRHGRCSLVFSGGNTPRALYALLASTYRDQIPWSQVHAFWGDERYVPPDDSASNYRMARESLLEQVPLPFQNIHPMPTHLPVAGGGSA